MSFGSPLALLALVALPVLAILYGRDQAARRRAAEAFSAPVLAPSVSPNGPGWRRHAPLLVLGLALVALIVAMAKPQRTVAVPVEQAQIMLVTDVSGSMLATDVAPNRLEAAKAAGRRFIEKVPKQVRVGVMAFNQAPTVLQSPTTDRDAVEAAVQRLRPSGTTATGLAIQTAVRILSATPTPTAKRPPAAIVLLSDGASVRGLDPIIATREAARLNIPIYTVALGTANGTITVPRAGGGTVTQPVPPDETALRQIAQVSRGEYFPAASAESLSAVYQRLGSQLGRKKEPRQITAGFAGAGLALLALGSLLTLRWFGRLI